MLKNPPLPKLSQKDSPLRSKFGKLLLHGALGWNWEDRGRFEVVQVKTLLELVKYYALFPVFIYIRGNFVCGKQAELSQRGKTVRDKRHVTSPWRNWKRMSPLGKGGLGLRMPRIMQRYETAWWHLQESLETTKDSNYRKL